MVWLGHGWGFQPLGYGKLPADPGHLAGLLPVWKVVEAENDVWGKLSQLAFFFFSSFFFLGGGFKFHFFLLFFPLFGGRFPIWLISFFGWVGSTTKYSCFLKDPFFVAEQCMKCYLFLGDWTWCTVEVLCDLPSRERMTYPTVGKRTSSSKVPRYWIC